MNGYAKADAYEGIEHGGNRRVRGVATQTLLLAFQLAHATNARSTGLRPESSHITAPNEVSL
ncbi:hypothetical protein [Actinomadura nitritigenes]|uniref:hypothetical protein n=1 Tax=Actinomadura nitritigenes TaxID=134602 RepID=UPI003D94387E